MPPGVQTQVGSPAVEVRRSRRRKRTVSAYRRDGKVIVMIPDRFTRDEEAEWVTTMLDRLQRSESRRRRTDDQLMRRSAELCRQYLHGKVSPASVRWVDNMTTRWGSCTTTTREIRLSDRLQTMPPWVVDYVLLHELAHLVEPSHNQRFWHWVDQFPQAERAKGYLEGVAHAAALDLQPCEDGAETD
jgi:predicted metal-dependent hydrolase